MSIDQYAAKIVQLINEKHMVIPSPPPPSVCVCTAPPLTNTQGVVTAACSLLEELAHINALGFSECVPLAVTKLFKVS